MVKRIHIYSLILSMLLLYTQKAVSQNSSYIKYTVDDGLPSNEVYHAVQDDKGHIWFATDNGVSRYNSYEFRNYGLEDGLPDNVIFFMYKDYKQRIWFISRSCQLSYFYKDSIYQYQYNDVLKDTLSKGNMISYKSFYVDSSETIYFGTMVQGLFSIDRKGFLNNDFKKGEILADITKEELLQGRSFEKKCFLTQKSPLRFVVRDKESEYAIDMMFEADQVRTYALKLGLNKVLFSSNKKVWVIDDKKVDGIYEFPKHIIWLGKANKKLWLSQAKKGVYCYPNSDLGEDPVHYLDGQTVLSVFSDKDEGIWITADNGVYYFPAMEIKNVDPLLLSNSRINSVESGDTDEMWWTDYDGNIYNLKKGSLKTYKSATSHIIYKLDYNLFSKRLFYSGQFTLGYIKDGRNNCLKGLRRLEPFNDKCDNFSLRQVLQKDDSLLYYIGSNFGEINLSNKTLTPLFLKREDHGLRPKRLFMNRDNKVYLGYEDGLWQYENGEAHFLGENTPLLQTRVDDIVEDINGNLWVASKGYGVVIKTRDTIFQIDKDRGLSSNAAISLCANGNVIWVGTMNGLNRITIKDFQNWDYEIENIYKHHGLASNIINDIAINNKVLYAGTDGGLSYFDISTFTLNQTPPPIYITQISIQEKDTSIHPFYKLDHQQNNVAISYVGINFRTSNKTWYKYRLTGADTKWTQTQSRTVRYSSLNPGDYTFEVVAMNENGIWGEVPAVIRFHIDPPYWQTWWFITILFVAFGMLVASVFWIINRIQLKEEKKQNSLRQDLNRLKQEALAQQMNPHFIFNTLSSIQFFISNNEKKASNKYLAMFAKLMRQTLNNSFQKTIPIREELDTLEMYIKLEQLRFEDKFEYQIEVDEKINVDKYKLPTLLLQPFVENSIWHGIMHKTGNDGMIKIVLYKAGNLIKCIVEDNGIGRKKSAEINARNRRQHKSMGAKITESRLKLIGNLYGDKLKIEYKDLVTSDDENCGTKVTVSLPIFE